MHSVYYHSIHSMVHSIPIKVLNDQEIDYTGDGKIIDSPALNEEKPTFYFEKRSISLMHISDRNMHRCDILACLHSLFSSFTYMQKSIERKMYYGTIIGPSVIFFFSFFISRCFFLIQINTNKN